MRCYEGAECTHHNTGWPRLLARCKDGPLTCCTLLAMLACPFCRSDAYFIHGVVEFWTCWPPAKFNAMCTHVCIFNQKHTAGTFSEKVL